MKAVLVTAVAATFLCAVPVDSWAQDEAILRWASESLHRVAYVDGDADTRDLDVIGESIGNAKVVALGEGQHAAAEPMIFRNRLFRYLVEERGFTAIALESGTVESRVVDDYVLGGPGALSEVVAQGFSSTQDDFPQNADLVRWMRTYNQDRPATTKIRFFGFDVPGSPTNGFSVRGVDTAVKDVIAFLKEVDPASASAIESRLAPFLPLTLSTYGQLSQQARDRLTGVISDLVGVIERSEWEYVAASSRARYDWAFVAALGARQIDGFLRFIPLGWAESDGYAWADNGAFLHRDRAMMDNMEWILSQLNGPDRILVFGALTHLTAVPVTHAGNENQLIPFGVYLHQRYPADVVSIGNVVSDGAIGNCRRGPSLSLKPPPAATLSHTFAMLGVPQFVLDLRAPPPAVEAALKQPSHLWSGFASYSVPVADAFDIAYFSGPLTPACTNRE